MFQSERADHWQKNSEEDPLDGSSMRSITIGRTDIKRINEPQDRIIGMLNESKNPQDRITKTLQELRSSIRTNKLINTQTPYTYAQAA